MIAPWLTASLPRLHCHWVRIKQHSLSYHIYSSHLTILYLRSVLTTHRNTLRGSSDWNLSLPQNFKRKMLTDSFKYSQISEAAGRRVHVLRSWLLQGQDPENYIILLKMNKESSLFIYMHQKLQKRCAIQHDFWVKIPTLMIRLRQHSPVD